MESLGRVINFALSKILQYALNLYVVCGAYEYNAKLKSLVIRYFIKIKNKLVKIFYKNKLKLYNQ